MTDDGMAILAEVGAILTASHFVYTSGRHGTDYVNKDALYLHPKATEKICGLMAAPFIADEVDVVVGPTIGGVILTQWVAWHLSQRRTSGEVLAAYAEEEGVGDHKTRVFRRGYDQSVRGKRIVVVEDVITTGGSVQKVIDAVRALGGTIQGISVLCNRGGIRTEDFGGVAFYPLTTVTPESWEETECPLCAQGVPINTTVGKGNAFLARMSAG